MVMLSKLLHFQLRDDASRKYMLSDLAVELLESDYPAVTHILCTDSARKRVTLPWEAVEKIDWSRSEIVIRAFDVTESETPESLAKRVLLRRDILDALVVDLNNRRATRANDLWLEEKDGQLLLKAADASARAVIRRLSRGLFGRKRNRSLYDWKYVEFLRGDPRGVSNGAGYHMRIKRLPPGEIAGLSNSLPYLHAAELLTLLPDPIAARALEAMLPERQMQVFGELEDPQALRLLDLMAANSAVDLLGRLSPELSKRFLDRLPKTRSDALVTLLRYPEDTVGGIMTTDFATLTADLTIRDARRALHDRLRQSDFTHFLWILEDNATRLLRGTVRLRDLITAEDDERIEQIINPYITTLDPLESARSGAYKVLDSHLPALPVVGRHRELAGIVTVDSAIMEVAPQNWRSQAPRVFS